MADVVTNTARIRPDRLPGDRKIAAPSARQHGVIAGWQPLGLGFLEGAVRRRLASDRRLHRLHSGASFNVLVAGLVVDALWPRERPVVELDGSASRRGRASFERDRRRGRRLQLAGYGVLRITHGALDDEPAEVAEEIRLLLERRRG